MIRSSKYLIRAIIQLMKATLPSLLLLVTLTSLLVGCTHTATRSSSPTLGEIKSERIISYKLGEKSKAYVGEAIASRKIYFYRMARDAYLADQNFVITGGILDATVSVQGYASTPYPIRGAVSFKGKKIDAIEVPGGSSYTFVYGITDAGKFSGIVAGLTQGMSPVVGVNQYHIEPSDVIFRRSFSSRVVLEDNPFENFEILYSGTSAGSIRLIYREYTRDNLVRPGFTQELTYPSDAKQIRFKGMLIEILAISPDSIEFRIVEDIQKKA